MDKVTTGVMIIIGGEALFVLAFPIVLLLIWRKKTGARMMPALVGAFTYFLFAYVLENLLHYFVIGQSTQLSQLLQSQPALYILYGCLVAGIFEESGRLLCGRFMLKNYNDRESAVTMGIGHGGTEMILLVGLSMISYFMIALSINAQGLSALTTDMEEEQVSQLYQSLASINSIGAGVAILAICERIMAMALHISLSILVFSAAKERGPMYLYPVAIGLHALCNVPAAMFQSGILTSDWLTIALTAVLVAPCVYLALIQYRKMEGASGVGKKPVHDLRDM